MDETKNCPEMNAQDTIQEENNAIFSDSLGTFIQGVVSNTLAHFHSKSQGENFDELKPILQDIRDSLKKQNQANKELYGDLMSAQNNNLRTNLLKSVIGIRDLMEENLSYISNKMTEEFGDDVEGQKNKVVELFSFVKKRIEEFLIYSHGLRAISPAVGETFNSEDQTIVGTEPTRDQSLNNTICRLEKSGFRDSVSGLLFKRADVVTYEFDSILSSDDE